MKEYEIINKVTNEDKLIYGYTMADAFRRNGILNKDEWKLIFEAYVD